MCAVLISHFRILYFWFLMKSFSFESTVFIDFWSLETLDGRNLDPMNNAEKCHFWSNCFVYFVAVAIGSDVSCDGFLF